MKIILPKTLAEPLTIPWLGIAIMTNPGMADIIKDAIRDYFITILGCDKEPISPLIKNGKSRLTPGGMLYMLQATAEQAGGLNVYGELERNMNGTKHIGYSYYVFFTIPGSDKLHHKCMLSWFPPVP